MIMSNKFIKKLGMTLDELYIENKIKYNTCTPFELEIYFNSKSLENKKRILCAAAFGC